MIVPATVQCALSTGRFKNAFGLTTYNNNMLSEDQGPVRVFELTKSSTTSPLLSHELTTDEISALLAQSSFEIVSFDKVDLSMTIRRV